MLILLSPSKTLDFASPSVTAKCTQPEFGADSAELVAKLSGMSKSQLAKLMDISPKLTEANLERYRAWTPEFTVKNSKPALLAFRGDVYFGFDLENYSAADFSFAQKHLRILSGLYGLLKPLDLIQPYRLEMGTTLKTDRGKDLYAFWGAKITDAVNEALAAQKDDVLVNLASNEYFSSIREDRLNARVITPVFKDRTKGGHYRILSFFAKRARGSMANHIIVNRLKNPDDLKKFDIDGYRFDKESSTEDRLVFLRAK
jgi:cytoplasmic iron level regulating protein YaaA (DUF328/UPF0246 family)